MSPLNIVYISDLFGFPEGQAGSSNIRLLCRGLIHAGCRTRVIIPTASENPAHPINLRPNGKVDGIDFEYTTGLTIDPPTWFGRKWTHLRGRFGTQFRLAYLKQIDQLDCVILYSRSYRRLVEMQRVCRIFNIPLIVHLVEWMPDRVYPVEKQTMDNRLFHSEVFKRIDAAIVISHYLEDIALTRTASRKIPLPIIRIPVLADLDKWTNVIPIRREHDYLLYCASIDGYLEDALFIIRAIARLKRGDLDLVMVGPASPASQETINHIAKDCGFAGKLDLQNHFVPEEELYSLYAGAAALLAPLQDNEVSRARFPFKLAGYLSSGKPVVSSLVGEVPMYLEDGKSAFLSRPGDLEHFSEKIMEAITCPNRDLVATAGHLVAQKYFDYRSQGNNLNMFSHKIITN